MLKQYNCRIDSKDINLIDELGGCRSAHIRNAIKNYIGNGIQTNTNQNTDQVVTILKDQIMDLKHDKEYLQKQVNFYSMPWYTKIKYLLQEPINKQQDKQ